MSSFDPELRLAVVLDTDDPVAIALAKGSLEQAGDSIPCFRPDQHANRNGGPVPAEADTDSGWPRP
ncbi:MAG: hypothetical protein JO033_14010 [Acidobacteriaceae bacterium]|nr:hypothetical protein [Acidobacteriaceae bacterium]MBV9501822.1 hypothetical protein [Acidobacteriaceae bacterium]